MAPSHSRSDARRSALRRWAATAKLSKIDETSSAAARARPKHARSGSQFRNVVLTLVERGGSARSFHIDGASIADLMPIVQRQRRARNRDHDRRRRVPIGSIGERVRQPRHRQPRQGRICPPRGDKLVTTNTVEGYYSIFKRGMKGVYQHCNEKHLHRYLAEFDFRYSNRVRLASMTWRAPTRVKGVVGKRLTYQTTA